MLGVRECEAHLSGGSASLLPRESVSSLLSPPAVLHPKKRISLGTPQRCWTKRRGVVEALSWNRGAWIPRYPRSCIRISEHVTTSRHLGEQRSRRPKVLLLTPGRIRQMLRVGEFEGDTARPQDVDDAPDCELVEGPTFPEVIANLSPTEHVFEGVG
jgi:hypothetical protein